MTQYSAVTTKFNLYYPQQKMSKNLQSNTDLMVDVFSQYEQEYVKGIASVSRKIESIDTQPNNKKELAFSQIKRELTDVERNLKYMEMEANNFPPQLKTQYQIKIRKCRKEYDELRRRLFRIQDTYVSQKNTQQLMGARLDEQGQNGKERLIRQGQLASHATSRLKQSVRTMRETQDIQNSVAIQLVSQTQRMGRMIQKPKFGVIEDLRQSQYFIKKIGLNIKKNKIVLGCVAGIVLLIIIIVVWVVVAKHT